MTRMFRLGRFARCTGPAVAAVVLLAGVARAGEVVRVGGRPAPVFERRSVRSDVVATVAPGQELDVLDREGEWVWVIAPPDAYGTRRPGWVNRRMLAETAARQEAANARDHVAGSATRDATRNPAGEAVTVSPAPAPVRPAANRLSVSVRPSLASVAAPEAVGDPGGPAPDGGDREVAPVPQRVSPLAAAAEAARRAAAERAEAARRAASTEPPRPASGLSEARRSALAEWIIPRALRASIGGNYQSANVGQGAGSLDDRLLGGGATLVTSFAILDPRIFSVEFTGDFQASRARSRSFDTSYRDRSGLQSYRLDVGLLSGRRAPLRLWADRLSATTNLLPFGTTLDRPRGTRSSRKGAGFTWALDADPALPHLYITASTALQTDDTDYLFGYSSVNEERRAELRASRDYKLGRYDLQFTHGAFVYDVPAAGVRSDTRSDVLLATGRLTPTDRLTMDLRARGSRFQFGSGSQASTVAGAGGDAAVRYELPSHVAFSSRYSFSNNLFEAAVAGQLKPGQPGVLPVTAPQQLATRTLFQDGEGRIEYATRPLTVAAIVKGVSFDVPATQTLTLSTLRTAGALFRAEHAWHGLGMRVGGDLAMGLAGSNRGAYERYREGGVEAGIYFDLANALRVGVDGTVRRTGRLTFFPVTLEVATAGARLETMRPGWARLRVSAAQVASRRDVLFSDANDRTTAFSVGLAGRWYDLSADVNQADSRSLLLAPDVLGSRPEAAILVTAHPEMFRNLLASVDRTRSISLQLRPLPGLSLQARGRRQEQFFPGLFGFRLNAAQAWASYQIRELQLEVGWEYSDSWTSFGAVRMRRVLVRLRRDVTLF